MCPPLFSQLLLEAGASADAPNAEGMLPLHLAATCRADASAAMCGLILRFAQYSAVWGPTSPQPEMVGLVGRTPFQMAAAAGREDVLAVFLASGGGAGAAQARSAAGATTFETNRRAEDGQTALTLAARGLHGGAVAALFAAGADGRLRLPGTRESFLHVGMRAANAAYKKSETMMDAAKAFAATLRASSSLCPRLCLPLCLIARFSSIDHTVVLPRPSHTIRGTCPSFLRM